MIRNPLRRGMTSPAIGLLLLLLSQAAAAEPPPSYHFFRYGEATGLARQQDKPVLVYFGRFGCSACLKVEQVTLAQASVRERLIARYVLAYVDTEGDRRSILNSGERVTDSQLAQRFRVYGTPTFLYLDANETPLARVVGFQSSDDLAAQDIRVAAVQRAAETAKGRSVARP